MLFVGILLCSLWAVSYAACSCPSGSFMPPGFQRGQTISNAYYIQGSEITCGSNNIQTCQQRCDNWLNTNGVDCVAFSYDADTQKCRLYSKQQPIENCGNSSPQRLVCYAGCVLRAPENNVGYCWGDPHCKTFAGVDEHQQGNLIVTTKPHDAYYYLFKNCKPSDRDNLPFALSARFASWSGRSNPTRTANIIPEVWLEMYVGGSTYMMQMSSDHNKNRRCTQPMNSPDRTMCGSCSPQSWSPGGTYYFGNKFKVTTSGNCNDFTVTLTVDGRCTWTFRMAYGGAGGAQGERWHKIWLYQPSCWKCEVCGLFGDLQTSPGDPSMFACGGNNRITFTDSRNWEPAANGIGWNDPWTWNTGNVQANCPNQGAGYGAKIGPPGKVIGNIQDIFGKSSSSEESGFSCPTEESQLEVIAKCTGVQMKQESCCDMIAEDTCSSLVVGCIADSCADYEAEGNSIVSKEVMSMTATIKKDCLNIGLRNLFAGLVPDLLYKFDDNMLDSISKGTQNKDRFDLQNNGLTIEKGALKCADAASSASVALKNGRKKVSVEVSVRVDPGSTSGCIVSVFGIKICYNDDNSLTIGDQNVGDAGNEVLHIVAALDGDNDVAMLFVDGKSVANFATSIDCTANTLEVCGCDAFQGEILQLAVFYKVLNINDAKELYETRMPEVCRDGDLEYESIRTYLSPGAVLQSGQCFTSPGKDYAILMKQDGSVVLVGESVAEKEIEGASTDACSLVYGEDGSLSVYNKDGSQGAVIESANNDAGFVVITDTGVVLGFADSNEEVYFTYPQGQQLQGTLTNAAGVAPVIDNNDDDDDDNMPEEEEEPSDDYNDNDNDNNDNDIVWNEEPQQEPDNNNYPYYEPAKIAAPETAAAATTSTFVYMLYITTALLAVNLLCGMVNCWYKATANSSNGKNRYKVVSIDSTDVDVDVNSDVEIQHLK